jgi:hypothetical protein
MLPKVGLCCAALPLCCAALPLCCAALPLCCAALPLCCAVLPLFCRCATLRCRCRCLLAGSALGAWACPPLPHIAAPGMWSGAGHLARQMGVLQCAGRSAPRAFWHIVGVILEEHAARAPYHACHRQ